MAFSGLFPDIDFVADLLLEYRGTIPAKVSVAKIFPDNDDTDPVVRDAKDAILAALWLLGETTKNDTPRYGAWIAGELSTDDGDNWAYIDDPLSLQLHKDDLVHVNLHVNLPQEEQYQNLDNLKFTGLITVIQWNEYPEP